jgi:signal transduction histidine kinase
MNIYRMVQECLGNMVKHAGATRAVVRITHHNDSINLWIEDDGKGMRGSSVLGENTGSGIARYPAATWSFGRDISNQTGLF